MIRMIACDLDETLLDDDKKAGSQNREAVKKAQQAGVKFVLCTGRPFKDIRPTQDELGLYEQEGEYSINFNGGAIFENKGAKLLHYDGISYEQALALFEEGLKHDVCLQIYTLDEVYTWNLKEDEMHYTAGRMVTTPLPEADMSFLKEVPIVKFIYQSKDMDLLHELEEITRPINKDMEVSYSSNRYLEFNKKGVSKGQGLLWLAKYLGIDAGDTMAIGDNINDLSMIKSAALGVGVANAVMEILPDCDVITKRDHNHGAVAEAIYDYVL